MTQPPDKASPPPAPLSPESLLADSPLGPSRVLVVDDQDDARETLREFLQLTGCGPVDVAENGAEALLRLAEGEYSVVITDLAMPRMNGMELIKEARRRGFTAEFIVTTGHGSINEAVQAMRLGAHDFLTKPVDPQRMQVVVQR